MNKLIEKCNCGGAKYEEDGVCTYCYDLGYIPTHTDDCNEILKLITFKVRELSYLGYIVEGDRA